MRLGAEHRRIIEQSRLISRAECGRRPRRIATTIGGWRLRFHVTRRMLYRELCIADGRSSQLRRNLSILVEGGRIAWIRPSDGEGDAGDAEVVDAAGCTAIAGMVDAHSHVTMPGGAHWIDRGGDPPGSLAAVAELNGDLLDYAGVRWARDVGAPLGVDPVDGRERALSLGVRDRWAGRPDRPYIRAAGTWLTRAGTMAATPQYAGAEDADRLLAIAMRQLDDGADLIKLYLDGPDLEVAPWTPAEIAGVVRACHERGVRVTAHATRLQNARAGVEGGIDCIEHGSQIDSDLAAEMARRGTWMVSTLAVFRSWRTFGNTTAIERFSGAENRARIAAREEEARASLRTAHAAGVAIAAGTDFGGGSTRANQLAWEVEAMVEAGLPPEAALAAVTWRGGDLLGEPDAGVIREGGPADVVLVHGDPLSDPPALWRVWRRLWRDR
jgi:imidazolonepropionase-like amidohydrolase